MKRYLTLCAMGLATVGNAQQVPVYTQDKTGLIVTEGHVSPNEAAVLSTVDLHGRTDAPDFLVLAPNGAMIPVFDMTPGEYDLLIGGDGVAEMVFDESEGLVVNPADGLTFDESDGLDTRSPSAEMSFDASEALDTRDTTRPAPSGGIQPEDGTWQVAIAQARESGCPPGASTAAQAQVSQQRVLQVSFTRPQWHPTDLSTDLAQYSWTPAGANGYVSDLYTSPDAAQAGMLVEISARYDVISPVRIETRYRISMTLNAALAAMAGSSQHCEVEIDGVLSK